MMLSVTTRRLLVGDMECDEGSRASSRIASDLGWQKHVPASSGYLELGMFDDAALALEEIEADDQDPR
jgi:hypothetical protein